MLYSTESESPMEITDYETATEYDPPNLVRQTVPTSDFAATYKSLLSRALNTIDLAAIENAARLLHKAREDGATIFVCGNGGSASTASHFACDMVKGASYARASRFRNL